jgi:hypothetical protein
MPNHIQLEHVEESARCIGHVVGRTLNGTYGPNGVGFCLVLFTFGESGCCTYVSNAQPEDMIAALRELDEKRHGGGSAP